MVTAKTGPNDAGHVVWATVGFILFFSCFIITSYFL